MALTLPQALSDPHPCACRCHDELSLDEREKGIAALYRCDDALRGWGYQPLYEVMGHKLWSEAQARNDLTYRGVPLRDEECIYSRLLGSTLHEILHALCGAPEEPNYGMGFGLPYGVPAAMPRDEERAWLARHNRDEARSWVGLGPLARALFSIEWPLRAARDVGTYCFVPGPSTVEVPAGFRPVGHVDRQHQPERYYLLARKLEDEAAAFFADEANLADFVARFRAAEEAGRARRPTRYPDPVELARLPPRPYGRNDLCGCGSGKKHKLCCGRP